MRILGMSKQWNIRPSSILEIDDCYTAYCFDEACHYILCQLENKKEPQFRAKHKSFAELYSGYENGVKHGS